MKLWHLLGGLAAAAIVAAIAIPNTIEARKHGNEAAAVGALKTLATAQTLFREGDKVGGGAPTFGDPARRFETSAENAWREATGEDLRSTFSVDVDTASYSTVRQYLRHRTLPPPAAVRIEELINAFDYAYPPPATDDPAPFAVQAEAAACPWAPERRLVRLGLKGREVPASARPAANLVFLVDVSGSMQEPTKLPLVKHGLRLLAAQLGERDRVAMVVYAGASGLVLPSTPGDRRAAILEAIDRLQAGGSTNGGAGIQLAYQAAVQGFVEGGANRVLLLTDGDFNVGVTDRDELEALIARRAKSGVFLSVLGFGMNHQDATLERLADRGNGHFAYVDSPEEAQRVLVEKATGTLLTIAKDVKLQVAWDPARVKSYRLLGYENRVLASRDFADDAKDAGDVGAGHTVTALYEVEVAGSATGPLGALELRWKAPAAEVSQHARVALDDAGGSFDAASADLRFAAAVAAFGMLLRGSEHAGQATLAWARRAAADAQGDDPRRAELVGLIEAAEALAADEPLQVGRADAAPADDPLKALGDAGLIDGVLADGTKQGYRVEMVRSPDDPMKWMAVANPVTPRATGDRWFVTNWRGVVYYSADGPFQLDASCEIPAHARPVGK